MLKISHIKLFVLFLLAFLFILLTYEKGFATGFIPIENDDIGKEVCASETSLSVSNENKTKKGYWKKENNETYIWDKFNNSTTVSGLVNGKNIFQWLDINDNTLIEEVVIVYNKVSEANIFPLSNSVCDSTFLFEISAANYGDASFSFLSGGGVINKLSEKKIELSETVYGENIFRYSIRNGICTSETTTTFYSYYEKANAGENISICTDSVYLYAKKPLHGEGVWSLLSGEGIIENVNTENALFHGIARGINTIQWKISNEYCSDSNQISITNNSASKAIANGFKTCFDTEKLKATRPETGTFRWETTNSLVEIANKNSEITDVNNLQWGDNFFLWIVENEQCADTARINVVSQHIPIRTQIHSQNPCFGDNKGSIEVSLDTEMENVNILWTKIDGAFSSNLRRIDNLFAGFYKVDVSTATSSCSSTMSVEIEQPTKLAYNADIYVDDNCQTDNNFLKIYPQAGTPDYTYEWSLLTSNFTTEKLPFTTNELNGIKSGTYQLELKDSHDCKLIATFNLVPPALNADDFFIEGEKEVLVNTAFDFTVNADNYQIEWSLDNSGTILSGENSSTASMKWIDEGSKTIDVKISNNCSSIEISKTINVVGKNQLNNGYLFSPNNDGINDFFELLELKDCPTCYPENMLIIYHSFGSMLIKFDGYQNDWNGIFDGNKKVPAGFYYFYFRKNAQDAGILGFIEIK